MRFYMMFLLVLNKKINFVITKIIAKEIAPSSSMCSDIFFVKLYVCHKCRDVHYFFKRFQGYVC